MDLTAAEALARQIGFEYTAPLLMEALSPREDVRQMCAADRCERFGRSWSCPPACGSLEHWRARFREFSSGLLVQTVSEMEDPFDLEGIRASEQLHKKRFDTLARQTARLYQGRLALAAGSCTRCRKCTYPGRPCRFPQKLYPSMEACGLLVSEVCRLSGMAYYYGQGTISYTSCVLFP